MPLQKSPTDTRSTTSRVEAFKALDRSAHWDIYLRMTRLAARVLFQPKVLLPLFALTLITHWFFSPEDMHQDFVWRTATTLFSVVLALGLAVPLLPVFLIAIFLLEWSTLLLAIIGGIVCTALGVGAFVGLFGARFETPADQLFGRMFYFFSLQNTAFAVWVYLTCEPLLKKERDQFEDTLRLGKPALDPIQLRLPAGKRGPVLDLQIEDKYLRIRTDPGEHTVRMSMQQALMEFDTTSGFLVNRSKWVNGDRIVALHYSNGNPQITTVDGERHIVRRGHARPIREFLNSRQEATKH